MKLSTTQAQIAGQRRSSILSDDLAVSAHGRWNSTKRAKRNDILSLDRHWAVRHFRRMGIGQRIAEARKTAGLTQGKLGEAVGAVQTTISSWERGRTEPTRDDVERIAIALKIKPSELELADGESAKVQIVGYVGAGSEAILYSEGQGGGDYVPAPEGSSPQTVAAEIKGVSLGPVLDSWLVFYDDVHRPVTPDMHNRLCVVGLADGRVLVKLVRPAANGLFHLDSNSNEPTLTDQVVEWAAVVKSIRPR